MIIAKAPLRVSFFGGGSDFPGYFLQHGIGQVLSSAIGLSVYAIVQQRWDSRICAHYTKRELVDSVMEIEHDLIRESMLLSGVYNGVEVTTLADVPSEGTGLGSSSAITVALVKALWAHRGRYLDERSIAKNACLIEIDRLGSPIGYQDQYAAAIGGLCLYTFTPDGVGVDRLELGTDTQLVLQSRLLLFYTGRTRRAATILAEQKLRIDDNQVALGQMARQAREGADYLLSGRLDDFGHLLDEAWNLKRSLASSISDVEIDHLYQSAKNAGAIGGKLCGAGGGGFLMLYVPPDRQDNVRRTLSGLREARMVLGAPGVQIIHSDVPISFSAYA